AQPRPTRSFPTRRSSDLWLERKKYKVHVRVFLSRYRGYLTCPECHGARLRREARDVRVGERTIDVVCGLTVKEADRFFETLALRSEEHTSELQSPDHLVC